MVVQVLEKLPLGVVMIVPFVLEIVGAVGLVGYLSFRNGQKAVNNLASQLMSEVIPIIQSYATVARADQI